MSKETVETLDLDRALDAYGSQAQSVKSRVASHAAVYTAAAGAALALASSADAAIDYHSVGQYFPIGASGTSNQYWIDFNGDSIDDFRLAIERASTTSQGVFAFTLPMILDGADPARLGPGDPIGPSQTFDAPLANGFALRWAYYIGTDTTFVGNWIDEEPGFLGIAIPNAGSTNYAWVRVSVSNDVNGIPIGFSVVDWAYETTIDTAIVIPEPAPVTALALLAGGAAGLAAWRRRKQSQKPS